MLVPPCDPFPPPLRSLWRTQHGRRLQDALISRRDVLKRVGIAGAAAAVPIDAIAQATREPFETLTAAEGATLEAIVARLIPTDANGPGASEARAARYIDRALGGFLASSRDTYRVGLAASRPMRASEGRTVHSALRAESGCRPE